MGKRVETTRIYETDDQFGKHFESMIFIEVGTDMMGHVRVSARNEYTDDPPVILEYLVQEDDPHETEVAVSKMVREAYMLSSLT